METFTSALFVHKWWTIDVNIYILDIFGNPGNLFSLQFIFVTTLSNKRYSCHLWLLVITKSGKKKGNKFNSFQIEVFFFQNISSPLAPYISLKYRPIKFVLSPYIKLFKVIQFVARKIPWIFVWILLIWRVKYFMNAKFFLKSNVFWCATYNCCNFKDDLKKSVFLLQKMSAPEKRRYLLSTQKRALFPWTFVCAPIIFEKLVLIKVGHYSHTYFTLCIPGKENLLLGGYSRFLPQRKSERMRSLFIVNTE